MSLPVIAVPLFPNIPIALGVPPLARSLFFPPTPTPPAMLADAPQVTVEAQTNNSTGGQWGIFSSQGAQVVAVDNVVSVEWKGEYRIADYPIEEGGFESYNKVKVPYDARLVLSRGGIDADRTDFLDSLETILASLELYTVTTPEKTYQNANVVHVDYDRSAKKGAGLISADVWVQEVRVAVAPAFSSTQQPSGADPVNSGTVQAEQPSTSNFDIANRALRTELF